MDHFKDHKSGSNPKKEADKMVYGLYGLYGLSEEKINIVKNS